MRDQAASLRELRANFDKAVTRTKSVSSADFLAQIRRESPLSAYILIYLDSLKAGYPDINEWLPQISSNPNNLYLWDQASLISSKKITTKDSQSLSFPILPKQMAMLDLTGKTDCERFEFLKNISETLDKHNEVWITIKSSEIEYYSYLFNAANKLILMLPDSEEAIIKGYEIVKKITNLKFTANISLLEFSSTPFPKEDFVSNRIKNVAKQFLGIDLTNIGVVLSNSKYISQVNENSQSGLKIPTGQSCSDFMYAFSENIVNLPLGTN